MKSNQKVVLITGASSGMGRATAIYLSQQRFKVYAGSRTHHKILDIQNPNLIPIKLDIKNPKIIQKAISDIKQIDILINNAKIKTSPFPFENIGGFLGKDDKKLFRVPILRNISKTAPYFHNGSVDKLEEAVRIMSKYQLGNEFNQKDIDAVVAFLKTLDGELVKY